MDIKDILSVGLTAEDFEIMLQGLRAIPELETTKLINTEIMGMILAPTAVHREQRSEKVEKKAAELRKAQEAKEEDYIILKSKLIQLKRYLLSNEAVKMANDILPPPKSS